MKLEATVFCKAFIHKKGCSPDNSTLVVDLIPNEPTEPESEQVTLDLEMEEEIISTVLLQSFK